MPSYTMSCFKLPGSLCKRIQSALTRFWWDASAEKKKMCWIAWSKMTKSKKDGGLGFKDISTFNDALLAKVSWRIFKSPTCLLARILLGKYCKFASFLDCPVSGSASHGWRGICAGRDLLKLQLGKVIGSGLDTLVWSEPWISLTAPITPIGPPTEQAQFLKVADLICPVSKCWDREKLSLYLPQYEKDILLLRPSKLGATDQYVWLPTKNGDYSAKTGYHAAASLPSQASSSPSQPIVFNWNKQIWNTYCSPKIKFLLWKVMKNALPVGSTLKARGINPTASCPHCGEDESCLHLFFTCPFASQIWDQAPFKNTLSTARLTSLKLGIGAANHLTCLPPVGIDKGFLFPWIVWSIWTCRNKKIFEQKQQSSEDVISQAIVLAKEWIGTQSHPSSQTPKPFISSVPSTGLDMIRCSSDAAWREDTRDAGFGWIFSDPLRQTEIQDRAVASNVSSPLMAEASAVLLATQSASALGFSNLLFASDSQQLVKALNGELQFSELHGILHDILTISLTFAEVRFVYVRRENNRKADGLAKSALNSISPVSVPVST